MKFIDEVIQAALQADPLQLAIVALAVVACGVIWLAALAITNNRR